MVHATIQNNIPQPEYRLGAEAFCYWLQGFFEISEPLNLTEKQLKVIKDHLSMVFVHKTITQDFKIPEPIITQAGGVGTATNLDLYKTFTTVC